MSKTQGHFSHLTKSHPFSTNQPSVLFGKWMGRYLQIWRRRNNMKRFNARPFKSFKVLSRTLSSLKQWMFAWNKSSFLSWPKHALQGDHKIICLLLRMWWAELPDCVVLIQPPHAEESQDKYWYPGVRKAALWGWVSEMHTWPTRSRPGKGRNKTSL